jgi:hypothetical protein
MDGRYLLADLMFPRFREVGGLAATGHDGSFV